MSRRKQQIAIRKAKTALSPLRIVVTEAAKRYREYMVASRKSSIVALHDQTWYYEAVYNTAKLQYASASEIFVRMQAEEDAKRKALEYRKSEILRNLEEI